MDGINRAGTDCVGKDRGRKEKHPMKRAMNICGRAADRIKKNKWNILILVLILMISCGYISRKEGYHMDELLSFELSNAEFTPWIVTTQPEGRLEKYVQNEIYGKSIADTCQNVVRSVEDLWKNKGKSLLMNYKADVYKEPVWISAAQFKKYLTTDQSDAFNYLSVYFNVKDDNHPPLHFMLLHTISSVFQGQIHPWMGCIINLASVLGICILLMKICTEFYGKPNLGRAVSLLYAASMGGIATILLIRMYALLTFWCILVLYQHLVKWKSGNWKNENKKMIAAIVCGFLTQFFFVFFMIFLALVTAVSLWCKKDRKSFLYYIRSMVLSGCWGLVLFPFAVKDVLYSGRGVEAVQNLSSGLSGMGERLLSFMEIIGTECFGGKMSLIFLGLALILLIWFAVIEYLKNRRKIGRPKSFYPMAAVLVPTVGYFLIVSKASPYYADRYIMPVFPLLALLTGIGLWWLLEKAFGKKFKEGTLNILLYLFVAGMTIPSMIMVTPQYLYQGYKAQEALSKTYNGDNCLCVYQGVGYYQNLMEFTNYKSTLMVKEDELLSRSPDTTLQKNTELVVLLENGISQEKIVNYLEQKYDFHLEKVLLEKGVHQDTILLMRKN